jgi:hypothetical protein
MVGKSSGDRHGSSPIWFLLLAIAIFALYSLTVALTTADDCGDLDKQWEIFPPGWECKADANFG